MTDISKVNNIIRIIDGANKFDYPIPISPSPEYYFHNNVLYLAVGKTDRIINLDDLTISGDPPADVDAAHAALSLLFSSAGIALSSSDLGALIPFEQYGSNDEAVAAIGVGKLYKSVDMFNGSPVILITV